MNVLVVGGGTSGLLSALIAREQGMDVTLIEKSGRVGGLWSSREVDLCGERLTLDEGLRLPVKSGISKWDNLCFHNAFVDFDWHEFDGWTREGSLFEGVFNDQTSCVDARYLEPEVLDQGICEMAQALATTREVSSEPANDDEAISAIYGPTFKERIFEPILHGMLGTNPSSLAAGVHRSLIPKRLIVADAGKTEQLEKKFPSLRGFTGATDHASLRPELSRQFLYPRSGGVGQWIEALRKQLGSSGVEFGFGKSVRGIRQLSREAKMEVQLDDGSTFVADRIVWTLPLVFLAMISPELNVTPIMPEFRSLGVSHVLLDQSVSHDVQYALNFSRQPEFFRVVFNNNITLRGPTVLTLEHLLPNDIEAEAGGKVVDAALRQLVNSGMLHSHTQMREFNFSLHRNYFPILSPEYDAMNRNVRMSVQEKTDSFVFVGRAASGSLFIDDIIREASEKLGEGHGEKAAAKRSLQ